MASEREQFPVVGALLNAADDAEACGYLESATALRLQARKMSDLFDDGSCVLFHSSDGTPIPTPTSVTPTSALGPANVALLAAGASHLLATQAETGAVQAVPNPEASAAWAEDKRALCDELAERGELALRLGRGVGISWDQIHQEIDDQLRRAFNEGWHQAVPNPESGSSAPTPTVSLAPDITRDPLAIGALLHDLGSQRDRAETILFAVMKALEAKVGAEVWRTPCHELPALITEHLQAIAPAPALREALAELISTIEARCVSVDGKSDAAWNAYDDVLELVRELQLKL